MIASSDIKEFNADNVISPAPATRASERLFTLKVESRVAFAKESSKLLKEAKFMFC